jgi:hypothetical protein
LRLYLSTKSNLRTHLLVKKIVRGVSADEWKLKRAAAGWHAARQNTIDQAIAAGCGAPRRFSRADRLE